jgi:hypothetical protein
LAKVLSESAVLERAGVRDTVNRLLSIADVIPLTASVLAAAVALEDRFRISGQDAIVLASVLEDLRRRRPSVSCFLNRNARDFDDPSIREELTTLNCKFLPTFGGGLGFLRHHTKP